MNMHAREMNERALAAVYEALKYHNVTIMYYGSFTISEVAGIRAQAWVLHCTGFVFASTCSLVCKFCYD